MRPFHQHNTRSEEGFSVIELVGVLTIISLIAVAAAPAFIKRIDHDFRTTERQTLQKLASGLKESCVRKLQIPTGPNWAATIASNLDLNISQVSTNSRKHLRLFVQDPGFTVNGASLPYAQGGGATVAPVNARGMILSTAAVPLPDLSSISGADFTNIWTTANGTKPTALTSWTGTGEDLVIERVEFAPIFHKVVLINVDPLPDAVPNRGYYAVGTNAATWLVPESRLTRHLIQGTVLNFYRSSGTIVDTAEILRNEMSFVYRRSKWGRRLGGSDESVGDFGELVGEFMQGPPPAVPKFAATQQSVINEVYSFLWTYSVWAIGDSSTVYTASGAAITPAVPPFAGTTANFPAFSRAEEARVHMSDFTDNLIH
jgi:type II secretory pathway pseudopilin PulG